MFLKFLRYIVLWFLVRLKILWMMFDRKGWVWFMNVVYVVVLWNVCMILIGYVELLLCFFIVRLFFEVRKLNDCVNVKLDMVLKVNRLN